MVGKKVAVSLFALLAIGLSTDQTDATATSPGIPEAPGFGIVASMAGLFAMALHFRRRNK